MRIGGAVLCRLLRFNGWALRVGWATGSVAGAALAVATRLSPIFPVALRAVPGYTALNTVILNLASADALTPLFNAMHQRLTPSALPAE